MKLIDHSDPDIQVYEYDANFGESIKILRILFLLIGIYLIITPHKHDSLFLIITGFTMCIIALYRQRIIINKRDGRIIKLYGLVYPLIRRIYSIRDYEMVVLPKTNGFIPEDDESHRYYAVNLQNRTISHIFRFSSSRTYFNSRKEAEKLAEFLGFPILDFSEGRTYSEDFHHKSNTVLITNPKITSIQKPAHLFSDIMIEADKVTVTALPEGLSLEQVLKLILLAVLDAAFSIIFLIKGIMILGIFLTCLGLLVVFNGIIIRRVLVDIKKQQRIEVTRGFIIVSDGKVVRKVSLKNISGIHCAGLDYDRPPIGILHRLGFKSLMPGMLVLNSGETLKFGNRINDEEMIYIYSIIMKMLNESQIPGTEKFNK